MSALQEDAWIASSEEGRCSFCRLPFGGMRYVSGRPRYLVETFTRAYSEPMGGWLTIASCQVCDAIREEAEFRSLAQAHDHVLSRLRVLHAISKEEVQQLRTARVTAQVAHFTIESIKETTMEPPRPRSETERRRAQRIAREVEQGYAARKRLEWAEAHPRVRTRRPGRTARPDAYGLGDLPRPEEGATRERRVARRSSETRSVGIPRKSKKGRG